MEIAHDEGFTEKDIASLQRVKNAMAARAASGDVAAANAFAGLLNAEVNRHLSGGNDRVFMTEARNKYDDDVDRRNLELVKAAMVDKAVDGDIVSAQALETLINTETRLQEVNRKGLDAGDKVGWSERVRTDPAEIRLTAV